MDGLLVQHRGEGGTVRVNLLVQKHITMLPSMVRTRTARSGAVSTDHDISVPATFLFQSLTETATLWDYAGKGGGRGGGREGVTVEV